MCVPFSEFCATVLGTCKLATDPVNRGSGSDDNFGCVDDNIVCSNICFILVELGEVSR